MIRQITTYSDVKPVEQSSYLSEAEGGYLSLGPTKSNLGFLAAKVDWLLKDSHHDEGSATLQPSSIIQSRSIGWVVLPLDVSRE